MEQTINRARSGAASSTSGSKTGEANLSRTASVSSTSSCEAPRLNTGNAAATQLASSTALKTPTHGGDLLDEGALPSLQEWWTPGDLAAYLHLTPNAITYHCRRLFPNHPEGHRYRLSHADAVRVYNYVRKFGCKKELNSAS